MSETPPNFFVPHVDAGKDEAAYAYFAERCGVSVPSLHNRVYSITFRHDSSVWTATVGEQLHGAETRVHGRGRQKRELERKVADSAEVLAIFETPGVWMVCTDGGLFARGRSRWENPFFAGLPLNAVLFDVPRSNDGEP